MSAAERLARLTLLANACTDQVHTLASSLTFGERLAALLALANAAEALYRQAIAEMGALSNPPPAPPSQEN